MWTLTKHCKYIIFLPRIRRDFSIFCREYAAIFEIPAAD